MTTTTTVTDLAINLVVGHLNDPTVAAHIAAGGIASDADFTDADLCDALRSEGLDEAAHPDLRRAMSRVFDDC
jgi:hypothetical protein